MGPTRSTGVGAAVLAVLCSLAAAPGVAQEGAVTGTVTDEAGGLPLQGVTVTIQLEPGGSPRSARTDETGAYSMSALAPGAYVVRFMSPGWEPVDRAIRVVSGETSVVSVRLRPRPLLLPGISTVARRRESLLEAPASVSVIDRSDVERRPQLSILDQARTLPGLDIVRTGLVDGQLIPRGFNRLFNARVLLLTDGRISQIPAARANIPSTLPATSLDIDRIEVVRGPASALYGPDAADGVVQTFTKSSFDQPGVAVALSSGVREQGPVPGFDASTAGLFQLEGRIAVAPSERWAMKLSGRWFRGTEWRHEEQEEASNRALAEACLADLTPANPSCLPFGGTPSEARLARIGRRDFALEHGTLDARLDWRPSDRTEVTVSSGLGWTGNGIALTGGGAAQVRESRLQYGQVRVSSGQLTAQAYVTQGVLDEAYDVTLGFPRSDKSTFAAAQLQHGLTVGARQRFVYGVDAQWTLPGTDRNGIYRDGSDISVVGGFLQSETDLSRRWKVVAAGRVDAHSVLPSAVASPRLALVFSATPEHSLRATFNRAFTTPLASFFFLDAPTGRLVLGGPFTYQLRSQGSGGDGFSFQRIDRRPAMKSPLAADPEAFLPSTTEQLYLLAQEYLRAIGSPDADVLDAAGPPPTEADVGIRLMLWDQGGQLWEPVPGGFSSIEDVPPLREEVTTTFELGYNGLIGERALLSVDAYYTEKGAFLGPFRRVSPHLFLDEADLVDFFVSRGVDQAAAGTLAASLSDLPLGVVTPREASDRGPTALATPRNYGNVHVFGAHASVNLRLTDRWSSAGAVSVVSDDEFDAGGLPVALNASTLKWSVSLGYERPSGLHASAQYRFTKGYPTSSLAFEGPVDDAHVVDAGLGYRLPWMGGVRVQLDVQNLFNAGYRTFAGAPEIGRVTMLRAMWVP